MIDPIASLRSALSNTYDIEREVGQGGYATVYLARDLKHDRRVAIKVLNANPAQELSALRFVREIGLPENLRYRLYGYWSGLSALLRIRQQ